MSNYEIPEPSLRRLPWYLAYAKLELGRGVKALSSTQIARGVGVESSVVAKDLSYVNVSGRTRVGYDLNELIAYLEEFLGFRRHHRAFLFGVGNLGGALLHDRGLEQFGLDIVAGFDAKYELSGTSINHIPIHHIDRFPEMQKNLHVEIGVLTVPVGYAQQVTDMMVENGVRAVWNFTPFRIQVPEKVVVQNTSIYAHLAVMYNRIAMVNE
ncbi:MAG: redox-sensing transcriptional repressor Rex [Paludibacter sp.]|nr:redox-sensing transcriptional repressor Rex [Bacteroidales bacterium]MCM1068843.1 redox-sensing transcriptional repressor Rex [Prevotella sp.]MCM1353104.1 redox-sensing transcriptional repressor Rex [Bacteroides sp.]MCM1442426.1 redox-sensing transcriptional repressor Rex [Muribaculum sp.]MCM1481269.1 redox-sensing transcriptional repressor Rex [Paludibacter sp.]